MEESTEDVPHSEKADQIPTEIAKDNEILVQEVKRKPKLKVIEAPVEEEVSVEAPPEEETAVPKRKGRPAGAKDSKPRARKVVPSSEVPPHSEPLSPPPDPPMDPVRNYFEARRMAVERAYHAQGEHWSSLVSHLM